MHSLESQFGLLSRRSAHIVNELLRFGGEVPSLSDEKGGSAQLHGRQGALAISRGLELCYGCY